MSSTTHGLMIVVVGGRRSHSKKKKLIDSDSGITRDTDPIAKYEPGSGGREEVASTKQLANKLTSYLDGETSGDKIK